MYDLLIKNGLVVDGSGDVPFLADVAVVGDSIAKIGHIDEPAKKVIDAQGKNVTPGFIDIHCHSDAIVFQPGKNPKRLQQGFTTEATAASPVRPSRRNSRIAGPRTARRSSRICLFLSTGILMTNT